MPLIITCSICKKQYALTEEEKESFWQATTEERQSIVCPNCIHDSYYGDKEDE